MPPGDTVTLQRETGGGETSLLLAYVNDAATETALQQGLADIQGSLEIHRGGIKAAIAGLQRLSSPRVLIVDIGGEDAPLAALEALAVMIEPSVCVLAIGDVKGLDFYREVTRGVGVTEYLAKPLSREMVTRHFTPLVCRGAAEAATPHSAGA